MQKHPFLGTLAIAVVVSVIVGFMLYLLMDPISARDPTGGMVLIALIVGAAVAMTFFLVSATRRHNRDVKQRYDDYMKKAEDQQERNAALVERWHELASRLEGVMQKFERRFPE